VLMFDRRSKWHIAGLTHDFASWLNDQGKWDAYVLAYNKAWEREKQRTIPRMPKQIMWNVWRDFALECKPIPASTPAVFMFVDGEKDLDTNIPAPKGKGGPVIMTEDSYEIQDDVDFKACAWWAMTNSKVPKGKITKWRSQTAHKMLDMLWDDPFKFIQVFGEYFTMQTGIDRGGRRDDGSTEVSLIEQLKRDVENLG